MAGTSPASNNVYRDNDAEQTPSGRFIEEKFRGFLATMPPGGKAMLDASSTVRGEYAGEMTGKFEIERSATDGSYAVTLGGSGAFGVAGSVKAAKGSAMAGLQGEVTFRFASMEEAADKLAALSQLGALSNMGGVKVLGQFTGLIDKNLDARALATFEENVASVQVGAFGELKGEIDAAVVKAGGSSKGEMNCRVDFQTNQVIFEADIATEVKGQVKGLSAPGNIEGVLDSSIGRGSLKGQLKVQAAVQFTKEEVRGIAEGKLSIGQVLANKEIEPKLIQQFHGDLMGAEVDLRRELPLDALKNQLVLLDPYAEFQVRAGVKVDSAFAVNADLGAAEVNASATLVKPIWSSSRTLTPAQMLEAVRDGVMAQAEQDRTVLALRTAASLRRE